MEELLKRLSIIFEDNIATEKVQVDLLIESVDTWHIKSHINILYLMQDNFALYNLLIRGDSGRAKQNFYLKGRIAEVLINKFNDYLFDYDFSSSFSVFMSDSPELLSRYAVWSWSGMQKSIEENKTGAIISNMIQLIIRDDWEGVAKRLETLQKLITKKKNQWLELDYAYFKALAEKDKKLVEQILNEFLSPKKHKERNRHFPLVGELISTPAYGYAKLAWIKGLEVDVNSPLVPKELLPIKPLDKYEDSYAFLK